MKVNTDGPGLQKDEFILLGADIIYRCRVEETGAMQLYDSPRLRPVTKGDSNGESSM